MQLFFAVCVYALSIILSVVIFFKWKFSYWRNKRVPYIEPQFPFGNTGNPFARKRHGVLAFQQHYHHFKTLGYTYGGLYAFVRPIFLTVNPECIKNIMAKDFHHFTDRGVYNNERDDPLSANLFSLEGHKWRNLRVKFTPTFTTGKMKTMFPTLVACGDPLNKALIEYNQKKCTIDIKDLLARYTTDVIGSCAFGLECNSFKEPEGDIRKNGKLFFAPLTKLQSLKFLIASTSPELGRRLRITIADPTPRKFFLNIVKETVRYRKQNDIVRNDFMHLLINLLDDDTNGEKLSIGQVAAQAFIFFLAGFETSSTTMTFCLCELAVNQDIQDKVRSEITSVLAKYNGEITYDAIMEMKYLNSVIDETLRKYPPLGVLQRVCVQEYKIPDTDIILEKNTRIVIPTYALHHDPEFFPNPEKFDPDRFNDDNKSRIRPFSYIPFGEGPRICIGLRFGQLQTKVGLVILLRRFKYMLNAKTQFPIPIDPLSFVLTSKSGVWLDIEEYGGTNK